MTKSSVNRNNLKQAILDWDGKSAASIGDVYSLYIEDATFITQLTAFMADESLQSGATWLLKYHLEHKGEITSAQTLALYQQLPRLNCWQSCLHFLQTMDKLVIDEQVRTTVEFFVRRCLSDNNKFVRAWAYNGLYILQQQYPQYKEEVDGFYALAMQDEAPSVKARIRNILKKKSLRIL